MSYLDAWDPWYEARYSLVKPTITPVMGYELPARHGYARVMIDHPNFGAQDRLRMSDLYGHFRTWREARDWLSLRVTREIADLEKRLKAAHAKCLAISQLEQP